MITLVILFYIVKDNTLGYEINPIGLIILYITFPLFIFVTASCFKQSYLGCIGLTTKQYDSILIFQTQQKDEKKTLNQNQEINGEFYTKKLRDQTACDKIKNLCSLLTRSKPYSLVIEFINK